jgi:14-3-3 protein epsilon
MEKRDECIYMAKLSEQTERFDEMVDYMKQVIDTGKELKDEERNLLSIAYKN